MRKSSIVAGALSLLLAGMAQTASAKPGVLPEKGVASPGTTINSDGVFVPGGSDRYVALGPYGESTIARVERIGGRVERSRETGTMSLPTVAEDGSGAGLSADGSTLVLAEPRVTFPQSPSEFALLDADTLRTRDRFTLQGDFSFDAISPDGSTLYFIEHTSPTDPASYDVRAYDATTGHLRPKPVIDPDEPNEDMQGTPVTRAMSLDGRWAYTLYEGYRDSESFVHALDTERGRAVCIDLDSLSALASLRGFRLDVAPGGKTLAVVDKEGATRANVDTASFEVSTPADESGSPGDDSGGGPGLVLLIVGLAGLGIAIALAAPRLRAVLHPAPASAGTDGREPGA
jgi:hypothetical protein